MRVREGYKKQQCNGPHCTSRRVHHERPDTPRGVQYVEVPEDYSGPAFCSISCQIIWQGTNKKEIWTLKKERE